MRVCAIVKAGFSCFVRRTVEVSLAVLIALPSLCELPQEIVPIRAKASAAMWHLLLPSHLMS